MPPIWNHKGCRSVAPMSPQPSWTCFARTGLTADVIDPLHDDLTDPDQPHELYDAVWANACLLHVKRADLPTVLERLRHATRPGGLLRFSVKGGDGEAWLNRGPVTAPRLFVYWNETDLSAVVDQAGWTAMRTTGAPGLGSEHWLEVWAINEADRASA